MLLEPPWWSRGRGLPLESHVFNAPLGQTSFENWHLLLLCLACKSKWLKVRMMYQGRMTCLHVDCYIVILKSKKETQHVKLVFSKVIMFVLTCMKCLPLDVHHQSMIIKLFVFHKRLQN